MSTSISRGWECPKCERIYAPSVLMCTACLPVRRAMSTTLPDPLTVELNNRFRPTTTQPCMVCQKYQWERGSVYCPDNFHFDRSSSCD